MKVKLTCGLIVIIFILNVIIVGWNNEFKADSPESNHQEILSNELKPRSNGVFNWSQIEVLSEPIKGQNISTGCSMGPDIAVEDGKIYVVWSDENNTNGAGTDRDIFFRYFDGSIWSEVQVISEPVPGQDIDTDDSSGSQIAVENGKIYVVWTSNNDTKGAGTDSDIFYRCNLTGSDWEPIQVISEPVVGQDFNTGDSRLDSIAVENGKIYVVWSDENNTNGAGTDWDIFYRWKPVPSLFLRTPKVTPNSGNTSTEFNFTVTYYQLNNTPPSIMKVKIESIEHSMLEVDQTDTNYTNGKKYYFKIKNLDIGSHTYEFNASDGINFTDTMLFSNLIVLNTLPKIIAEDNLTAVEDQYYEVTYEFEDMDIANVGQSCHWEFKTNASWLDFDSINGSLCGTPGNEDVGQCWVYVAVNDTIDINFTNFTLKVLDVNDNPIIITDNVEVTNEDELYEVDYSATDIDSPIENQIWSFETNATSWLNFSSSSGILNGTPTNDDVREYWVNVSVNDTEGGFDFKNYTLTVLNVNDKPKIITVDILIAETDKLYEVDYNATDIDSPISQFTWTLDANATWLSIDPVTGVLSGTPTRNDAGLYNVNVTVSDGDGGSNWHEFILTVYKGNLPPIITTEDVITAMVNKYYEADYNATDDKPLIWLSWSLKSNASWLSLDSTTGVLSGTPAINDGGKQYWVNVSVSDGDYAWDFHNFTLTVLKEPVIKNNIPKLSNFELTPVEGDTDTEFTFSVHYFDADNETPEIIQVVIDGNAYDMDLKYGGIAYNGKYEYKTTLSEAVHTYYFTTSDGSDTNTSGTFSTPYIEKLAEIDGDDTREEGTYWEWIILGIVIVVIVTLIIIFLIIRRRKKPEQEITPPAEPESSELEEENALEPGPSDAQTPTQEQKTEEPLIQDDIY